MIFPFEMRFIREIECILINKINTYYKSFLLLIIISKTEYSTNPKCPKREESFPQCCNASSTFCFDKHSTVFVVQWLERDRLECAGL